MKKIILSLLLFAVAQVSWAQFILNAGKPVVLAYDKSEGMVVHTALELFTRDCQAVLSAPVQQDGKAGHIVIGTVGKSPLIAETGADVSVLEGKKQAFLLTVLPDGKLLVAGSDQYGTAYGIMELSRSMGVSPWEWWADVTPERKDRFELPAGYKTIQAPSVEYRGIFINDEDWGLMPWSSLNYEPWYKPGRIGPRTNERILSYCCVCVPMSIGLPCTSVPFRFS